MKKKIGLLATGLLAVTASLFIAASPSVAAVESDCKSVTYEVTDRLDSGHGTPAGWAMDTFKRTVQVCKSEAPKTLTDDETETLNKTQPNHSTWDYTAKLTDVGTFVTKGSATGSPNDGKPLTAGVKGTLNGEATFAKFKSAANWKDWDGGKYDKKKYTGTQPGPTGDSIKMLFDGDVKTQMTDYKWTYKTCSEQWVDSSEKSNDDGKSDTAGDITGKACASPSPSASPSSPMPSASAPPVTGQPSLPVTGTTSTLFMVGGLALVCGGGLLAFVRRRKVKFTP